MQLFATGELEDAERPPLHIGLLFDTSGSMSADLGMARSAAVKFCNLLQRAEDITLVDFDTEVRVARFGQADFPRFVERLRNRKPDGWTALYDALGVYLDGTAYQSGEKIMVAYTDGGDTRSVMSFGDALTALKASDVTVYIVGFLENQGAREKLEQRMRLTQIAEATGGLAFFPGTKKDIDLAYEQVQGDVKSRYLIGYVSSNQANDGTLAETGRPAESPGSEGGQDPIAQGLLRPDAPRAVAARRSKQHLRPIRERWQGLPARPTWHVRTCQRGATDGTIREIRSSFAPMPSTYDRFQLVSSFELRGDQPRAIDELVSGLERGDPFQTLLGVTGSGKTFTMAQTIARVNRPALVMVHNKTLAAQLYQEFRRFFPHNAVEYFVSYYDYYQPEAYMPATDSYIEKEAIINEEIDRMRLSATRSLFERRDVIIVSSVSCIYGLGSPEAYYGLMLPLERGQADRARRDPAQAGRNPVRAQRRRLRARHLPRAWRRHRGLSVLRGERGPHRAVRRRDRRTLDHRPADRRHAAPARQGGDLPEEPLRDVARPHQGRRRDDQGGTGRAAHALEREGRLLEAQRLHQRTMFDLAMMQEIGYCHGIENYARHLTGRPARARRRRRCSTTCRPMR